MLPVDIICPRCGWRNETTARMCGGCGRPLVSADPSATVGVPASFALAYASPSTPPVAPGDAPTELVPLDPAQAAPAPAPARGTVQAGDTAASTAVWQGPDAARGAAVATRTPPAPRSGRLGRVTLIASVVLIVLLVGLLGAWALVVRPAIHTALDRQIRSALNDGMQQAVALDSLVAGTRIPPTNITIPASDFNQAIAADLPSGTPVSGVAVHFADGQARITYSFWGRPGAVTTTLALSGRRPVATGTTVDCPLCLVESGDEMQAAFNDALGRIPATLQVTRIRTDGDALVITVQSAS